MKRIKKIVRLLCLSFIIILAACGMGFMGSVFPTNRERFENNKIRTELVERKDEETSEDDKKTIE